MSNAVPSPNIMTCPQWGARKPKANPVWTDAPDKIIIHHTDGNGAPANEEPNLALQARKYAQDLQYQHMVVNGWNDSGHNFLVMRSGIILQGRWGTVTAIEHGRMVVSAHCPGQNDQPGIEHEHIPGQLLTDAQLHATVHLMSWICDRTGVRCTQLFGHGQFYNTACPSNLAVDIPSLRVDVAKYMSEYKTAHKAGRVTLRQRLAMNAELSA